MEKTKKKREVLRASLIKTLSDLDVELAKVHPDKVKLEAVLPILLKSEEYINVLTEEIQDKMLDDVQTTPEMMGADMAECHGLILQVNSTRVKINGILHPTIVVPGGTRSRHGSGSSSNSTTTSQKRSFKLPKAEYKKFSGELKEWLGWWAYFEKIHLDDEIHESDKFGHLDQCMVKGSRAEELVNSYPHSTANYTKAIEALKGRFGNKKILKQLYVRELITMISSSRNKEKWNLSSHFDKLVSHLRSLESLGVSVEQMVIFLYPMVESSLPEDTLVAWQHSRNFGKDGSTEDPPKSELDYLLDFINEEIELEEQRKLARSGFATSEKKVQKKKEFGEEDYPTSAGLFSSTSSQCIFCDKTNHSSSVCFRAGRMTLEDRRGKVNSKKACHWCLKPRHAKGKCPSNLNCSVCGRRHETVMCPGEGQQSKANTNGTSSEATTTTTSLNFTNEVILRTIMVKLINPTNKITKRVRMFLDCGSQRSYMLKKTAEDLGLVNTGNLTINHQVFGGGQMKNVDHQIFDITLASTESQFSTRLKIMDQDKICGNLPRITDGPWKEELKRKGIKVNDTNPNDPMDIEILIGTDKLGSFLTGKLVQISNGLTATETRFGWCVMGPLAKEREEGEMGSNLAMSVMSMSLCSATVPELWKLDTLGIRDPIEVKTQDERDVAAYQHFQKTVKRNSDGRYSVSLPWIDQGNKIPSNRVVAEKRLETTTRKLTTMDKFLDYDKIFKAWELESIISRVTTEDGGSDKCHYLPHRAVLKESKTTPIRPVFDASCKVGRAPSLNECLERGPNLLELIPAILMRFRMKKIGVTSDIRKAFQMIELQEEDRDAVRFLWWEDAEKKKMVTFRHNRVVFGMNCSPFLLGAVLNHHLEQKKTLHPEIVKMMIESIYVDNCVTSVNSEDDYRQFKLVATELLDDAGMELRQWEYTGDNNADKVGSVLGLIWDKSQDTLFCAPLSDQIPPKVSKRLILSKLQQVFDPLGFLTPVLVLPKILLQRSWLQNRGWEEEVTREEEKEFREWWEELLPMMDKVRLPRRVTGEHDGKGTFQLHVFCDASKVAYAAAVFLRVSSEAGVSIQLIEAKSRVAPLKKSTIPRLELLSCCIAARLASSVKKAMSMEEVPTKFWTDSTTALSWIRRSDIWGTFVGNRVKEIVALAKTEDWNHVPGRLNPADLPSRGISPSKFLELKWWEGPSWLRQEESQWPNSEPIPDEEEITKERKINVTSVDVVSSSVQPWYLIRNSYFHSLRVMALVLRFIAKLRKSSNESQGDLSVVEIDHTEQRMWKLVQQESFLGNAEVINGVKVVRDNGGLLRVLTKLVHRQDTSEFKYPVLLPGSHPLVQLMLQEVHAANCHAGAQFLMSKIRERCWIFQGKRSVRKMLKRCVICQRYTAKSHEVPTASLPEDRVKDAGAFEVTGIDLAGPLMLRDETKVWIVVYTCAVYRCVHLELVDGLSTEDFLLSFIRFCKRRRRPATVYTDRGTNFRGAVNDLDDIDWERVKKRTQQERIHWIFNPPAAPWWGGWWERLIRTIKDLLKRMLGFRKLSKVELETCLCEVESALNHRPLTLVTEDSEDLIPLTPAMFLHSLPGGESVPEAKVLTIESLEGKKKRLDQLLKEVQQRFRKEYLALLVQKPKKKQCREFNVGDCVLIGKENVKRILWPMGRIMELFPGKDGIVRVAKLRVKKGTLIRPLQRLYPLEFSHKESAILQTVRAISTQDDEPKVVQPSTSVSKNGRRGGEGPQVPSVQVTRSGRVVKPRM